MTFLNPGWKRRRPADPAAVLSGLIQAPPVSVAPFQRRFSGIKVQDYDFAAGALRGARWWSWRNGQLHGACAPWTPGENVATCLRDQHPTRVVLQNMATGRQFTVEVPPQTPCKTVPDESCACGFYGFWGPKYPHYDLGHPGVQIAVTGVVEGYGVTVQGEYGFRCSKARIVAATVFSNLESVEAQEIARLMDVPRELLDGTSGPVRAAAGRQIAATYDIPVFPGIKAMLAEFPLTPPPEAQ